MMLSPSVVDLRLLTSTLRSSSRSGTQFTGTISDSIRMNGLESIGNSRFDCFPVFALRYLRCDGSGLALEPNG